MATAAERDEVLGSAVVLVAVDVMDVEGLVTGRPSST
jgi:hypothetical protein